MRVVLSGYYGFDNAGDEALLTAINSSLRAANEDVEVTVLSGNPQKTALIHGVRAVSRISPRVLIRELFQADMLISGGGSLLQDVTGPLSIPYYLGIAALAKLLGTPVVFYAQGIGPVRGKMGRLMIRIIANRVDLITLRDQESADFLRSLQVNTPTITVTADPVFSLRPTGDDIEAGRSYLDSLGVTREQSVVGVSIREWPEFDDKRIAAMLDALVQPERCLLLLPLQHPADLIYAHRIRSLMDKPVLIAEKPMNSNELMGVITHLSLMVGMRLHSLIFAACAGIPFEGISYDPKINTFLELFGQKPLFDSNSFDSRAIAARIDQAEGDRLDRVPAIVALAGELKEKADHNARLVSGALRRT